MNKKIKSTVCEVSINDVERLEKIRALQLYCFCNFVRFNCH